MSDSKTHDFNHFQQQSIEGMRALMMLPSAAGGRVTGTLQQHLAGVVAGVVQINLRASQQMLRATTPGDVLELQQNFMRDYMAALIKGTMTLVQAIHETAEQAAEAPPG